MRTICFVLATVLFLGVSPNVFAEDIKPIAPSNPVEVTVEVGSVAGQLSAKIVVELKITVAKKGTTFITVLKNRSDFDYAEIELEPETTAGLISVLAQTTANPDADFKKDVGGLQVENKDDEGKRVVSIRVKEEGISFRSKKIEVDSDNALLLHSQLKKLQGIAAWMKDKVAVFERK